MLRDFSAGVGRTGAFIVIDVQLERLRYENTVDIYGCVAAIRSQRNYMVQTEDQYVFIYDAVLDAVQSGCTEVPVSKLYTHIQKLMQTQPLDNASAMELEFRVSVCLVISENFSCDYVPPSFSNWRQSSYPTLDSRLRIFHVTSRRIDS